MVARVLNICGMYLGPAEELLPSSSSNPEGHWEHSGFVDLNNRLLEQFGGTWDLPPRLPAGWEQQARIDTIRTAAEELAGRFKEHALWGWKDPRNSLTYPFWRSQVPGLKLVICLRHPLDVTLSLQARGAASTAYGLTLWALYNQAALDATQPADRIITPYEAWFQDAPAELRRVLGWLGAGVSDTAMRQACAAVSESQRHHAAGHASALALPETISQLYQQMCLEAGWTNEATAEAEAPGPALPVSLDSIRQTARIITLETRLAEKEAALAAANDSATSLRQQIAALQAHTAVLGAEKAVLSQEIEALRSQIHGLQITADTASAEVEAVHKSRPWRLAVRLWGWRDVIRRRVAGWNRRR